MKKIEANLSKPEEDVRIFIIRRYLFSTRRTTSTVQFAVFLSMIIGSILLCPPITADLSAVLEIVLSGTCVVPSTKQTVKIKLARIGNHQPSQKRGRKSKRWRRLRNVLEKTGKEETKI